MKLIQMETGQKIILKNNNITGSIYELSIQVNLNGLSFFVLNTMDSKIEFLESVNFDKKLTPQVLLDRSINSLF